MSSLWCSYDERNHNLMTKIIKDIASKGLRTIFKQEWNSRYKTTLGEWDDTPISGQELYTLEKGRKHAKEHLLTYKQGKTDLWDCTVLFDAIIFSNAIGKAGLNPITYKEVDNLRVLRNIIIHLPKCQLPDKAFENASNKVRSSFIALGLPITEIDAIISEQKRKVFSYDWLLFFAIPAILIFLSLTVTICFTSWLQPSANSKHVLFKVLPPLPVHEVVNRTLTVTAILNDLRELYKSSNSKLTYFYISGNPGSGKSQLSRLVGQFYDGYANLSGLTFVMTLKAETLQNLLESYEDFARRLNCTERIVANIINSTQSIEIKIRHLRTQIATRIKTYHSWLVIVDNVENLKNLSSLLPQRRDEEWNGGQLLITTQDSLSIPPNSSLTSHISVSSGMGVTESCHLLAGLSGTGDAKDPMLAEVAKQLDYQPLAMAAAAIYLNEVIATKVSPKFSWHNYLEEFDERKGQLTGEPLRNINSYSLTMTTAVLLAVNKAAETDAVLNHTFNFLSLASHESLPLDVVINYVLFADKNQDREQVGIKIRKCSLILPEDSRIISIRLHRIVHDVIKVYAAKRKLVKIMIYEIAAQSFYQSKHKFVGRTLVPHLKEFHAAMTKIPWNTKTCSLFASSETAKIFLYFGSVLFHYGEYSSTKHFLTTALQILRLSGGNDSNDSTKYLKEISNIQSNLGVLYEQLGNLKRALKYQKRALGIRNKLLGSNHLDVTICYSNLGSVYKALGDLQQAKQYHERALNIRIKQLGSKHLDVATSYNNLGKVYLNLGGLQQAKQYFKRSLDIRFTQLGSKHLDVADSYNNLGIVYQDLDELQQAKQYYELSLDIHIKELGSNHVKVGVAYNNLGNVHDVLEDLQLAKQYYERAVDIYVKQLGPNHVDIAATCNNLGNVHQKLGDLQQAKEYNERAAHIYIKHLESNHADDAVTCTKLGNVYQALGDQQQAQQYYKRAKDIRVKQQSRANEVYRRRRPRSRRRRSRSRRDLRQ